MFRSAAGLSYVAVRSIDPTDHGSNLTVVAGLAVGILVFIGLLVFLITRRDRNAAARRAERLTISRPPSQPESRSGARSESGGTEPDEGSG